jgi:glucose/arabinose dehydrogenase
VIKIAAALVWLSLCALAGAQTFPPNFTSQPVAQNLNQAIGVTFTPQGLGFLWEKGGRVRRLENGQISAQALIDISEEVGDWRDFGLLGFAPDPNFATNGRIYLLYVVDYHHARYFGTPQYNPATNEYFRDTIARLTRYTCDPATGFTTIIPGSRRVLVGETLSTGFPVCHQSHSIGTLLFGEDGTLLVGSGDGASYEEVDNGGPRSGSSNTARADGIIRAKEDVGAFRAQLVDSLCGKIIRINPENGDGIPSNPFYNAALPRSAASRVWVMGFRNPFRFALQPGTGVADPAAGDPGTLLIGDVGWYLREEFNIAPRGGMNFGWPVFEGLDVMNDYRNAAPFNQDARNPLFGTGGGGCPNQYFRFSELIVQETLGTPSWPNPCNPAVQIPSGVRRFQNARPEFEWGHGGPVRVRAFSGNNAAAIDITDPASPVTGTPFDGSSATGGVWYSGTQFPPEYRGTYFLSDFAGGWLRVVRFNGDAPNQVATFGDNIGAVTCVAMNPADGTLYYTMFDQTGSSQLRRIFWTDNAPPTAIAASDRTYGPAPLTVRFTGSGSTDPEGQPLSYLWNFGDGTTSTEANPVKVFDDTLDVTASGQIMARVFELNPPRPTGGGNWDPEIMRDGDFPPVGSTADNRQFDTYHGGEQGTWDYVGYQFARQHRFRRIVFQEGKHFFDGGWWESAWVYVRRNGVWSAVQNLSIVPAYRGNDGQNYDTYVLSFTPIDGEAIIFGGDPGGTAGFISVGELRVIADATPAGVPRRFDVTLRVTDPLGQSSATSMIISTNNTPPVIRITSPVDLSTFCVSGRESVALAADVRDAEHPAAQLSCEWQTLLHHDEHEHPEPVDRDCETGAFIEPHGNTGDLFWFEFILTVTDAQGLSARASVNIYPNCCPQDFNGDGFLDFFDFDDFVSCFEGTGCPATRSADYNADGFTDFFDFDAFVVGFSAGC